MKSVVCRSLLKSVSLTLAFGAFALGAECAHALASTGEMLPGRIARPASGCTKGLFKPTFEVAPQPAPRLAPANSGEAVSADGNIGNLTGSRNPSNTQNVSIQ